MDVQALCGVDDELSLKYDEYNSDSTEDCPPPPQKHQQWCEPEPVFAVWVDYESIHSFDIRKPLPPSPRASIRARHLPVLQRLSEDNEQSIRRKLEEEQMERQILEKENEFLRTHNFELQQRLADFAIISAIDTVVGDADFKANGTVLEEPGASPISPSSSATVMSPQSMAISSTKHRQHAIANAADQEGVVTSRKTKSKKQKKKKHIDCGADKTNSSSTFSLQQSATSLVGFQEPVALKTKLTTTNTEVKKQSAARQKCTKCTNIHNCVALKRIMKALRWYGKYCTDAQYTCKMHKLLVKKNYVDCMLSDYQHVLDVYLHADTVDVQYALRQIGNKAHEHLPVCNEMHCPGLKRSHEYAKTHCISDAVLLKNKQDEIDFYALSLDLIHCNLLHE